MKNYPYNWETLPQWGSAESCPRFQSLRSQDTEASGSPRASSCPEMRSIDAVREEFRLNGVDSPFDPEEEFTLYHYNKYAELGGLGLPSGYLRQKSWPAPDATPAMPIPAPGGHRRQGFEEIMASSVPGNFEGDPLLDTLTDEQFRVLHTLPNSVLYLLLKELEYNRVQQELRRVKQPEMIECRFCKKNGEKESFYRSHRLRWHGRVVCPVLRAFCCERCGAKGDHAHTRKYCPLTSDDERLKSANMMRSIRSARRRSWHAASGDGSGRCGDANPVMIRDGAVYNMAEPLEPIWEALARKLML